MYEIYLFATQHDFDVSVRILQSVSAVNSLYFETIKEFNIVQENGESVLEIICYIDRLIGDYFTVPITLDVIRYFCSDLVEVVNLVETLKDHLQHEYNVPFPYLFSELSVAIQSDTSSPIPVMKVSFFGFVLPHIINSVKNVQGLSPYLPLEFQTTGIEYSDITTKVEINSLTMFIHKLIFQSFPSNTTSAPQPDIAKIPSHLVQYINCLPLQFIEKLCKRRLPTFSKIVSTMQVDEFFVNCTTFKHCLVTQVNDIFSVFSRQNCSIIDGGTYGAVFNVSINDKFYAVKEFAKEHVAMKEARTLNLCKHPNIVTIYQFIEAPNSVLHTFNSTLPLLNNRSYYIVMECSAYGSLTNVLEKNPNGLSLEIIQQFTIDINNALKYLLYEKRLVHRDIKSRNILVFTDPNKACGLSLKLCDFGFARYVGDNHFDTMVVGTSYINQPEIKQNQIYNDSCDLFSVGVVLFEMITSNSLYVVTCPDENVNETYKTYREALDLLKPNSKYLATQNNSYTLLVQLIYSIFQPQQERIGWEEYFNHMFFSHKLN
ncbi:serine-threonine protein kinase, putative [Entamoeba invadens IP1]|uniref:Serine-threonine protein kinase, putative n=1 Tax=Entamoeba invadens IP1 TaxID=370355 RepID=A0A0A1UCU7_ENTIV|nr:serine-threonine protein kinase, putative [Entamoeba invadens IP1]ELP90119.1 serine-threonine protein kinase, putative [Entamoeba invadens IP1]|eukprot:XP_004256890.1 serine-threonine protein kinase, putative [Entamoeba invadens IP1]